MWRSKSVPSNLDHESPHAEELPLSVISKRGALNVKREHYNLAVYLKDPFHSLVDMPWLRLLGIVCMTYVTCWFAFAVLYNFCEDSAGALILNTDSGGCIGGVDTGSAYLNSLFFSMQTMTTIGFGNMHPKTIYANFIVGLQSLVGIMFNSTLFGIIFVKFARPQTRCESIKFSKVALITQRDGKTCLTFRILNVRKHMLVQPRLTIYFVSNQITTEGEKYMKFDQLKIFNSQAPFLGLPWTVVHHIDETSPLYKCTNERMQEIDAEVLVTLEAMDASSSGAFQARYYYKGEDIREGIKFEDIITKCDDGQYHVDHAKFHEYIPSTPASARAMLESYHTFDTPHSPKMQKESSFIKNFGVFDAND